MLIVNGLLQTSELILIDGMLGPWLLGIGGGGSGGGGGGGPTIAGPAIPGVPPPSIAVGEKINTLNIFEMLFTFRYFFLPEPKSGDSILIWSEAIAGLTTWVVGNAEPSAKNWAMFPWLPLRPAPLLISSDCRLKFKWIPWLNNNRFYLHIKFIFFFENWTNPKL